MLTVLLVVMVTAGSHPVRSETQFDYTTLDELLKKHVKGKLVDYEGLRKERAGLDRYITFIEKVPRTAVDNLPRNEQIAFWINSYNALVLRSILDAWPVMSVKNIPDHFNKKWPAAGRKLPLDYIRLDLLCKSFKEPRAILACCDGSAGSRPLQPYAINPDSLEVQLDRITREALNDDVWIPMNAEQGVIDINLNLYWFREILIDKYGSSTRFVGLDEDQHAILNFIYAYATGTRKAELEQRDDWKMGTTQYMWVLNSDKRPPVPKNPDAPKRPTRK